MKKKILAGFVLILVVLFAFLYEGDIDPALLKARYGGPASKYLDLNGLQVHYRDEGQGPCLTLVHGTAASLHTWDGWTERLKDSFRVIRMDTPAFGITGPSPGRDYSIKAYTSFLAGFWDALGIKKCHLAGNSLGGLIAWNTATDYPGRVDRLILLDSSGFPRQTTPFIFTLARIPVLSGIFKVFTPRSVIEANVRQVYGNEALVTEETVNRYHDMARRAGNRQAFIDRANTDYRPDTSKLKSLQIPVLIMWGDRDRWILPSDAERFHKAIPGSKLIIYPGAGHIPMEELPERTAADARAFLSDAGTE